MGSGFLSSVRICSCSVVCQGVSMTPVQLQCGVLRSFKDPDTATVSCAQGLLESSGAHVWYINARSFSAQPICSVLAHEFLRSTDLE